jgi:hypothetical protein
MNGGKVDGNCPMRRTVPSIFQGGHSPTSERSPRTNHQEHVYAKIALGLPRVDDRLMATIDYRLSVLLSCRAIGRQDPKPRPPPLPTTRPPPPMTRGRSASARCGRIRPRSHPASTMREGGGDRRRRRRRRRHLQRMRRRRSKPGRRKRSDTLSRITMKSPDDSDTPPPRAARRTGGRRRRRWWPRRRTMSTSTMKCGIGFPTSAMDPWRMEGSQGRQARPQEVGTEVYYQK